MRKVIALARSHHNGWNVYKSKEVCVEILHEVEEIRPPWWTPRCSAFLRHVSAIQTDRAVWDSRAQHGTSTCEPIPVIVLEGLDGTGKSSVARELAKRLHGIMLPTPDPSWSDVRESFRAIGSTRKNCYDNNNNNEEEDEKEEVLGRAFYSAANYIAADQILSLRSSVLSNSNNTTAHRETNTTCCSNVNKSLDANTISHNNNNDNNNNNNKRKENNNDTNIIVNQPKVVIMDRWWCSTCAMALAHHVLRACSNALYSHTLLEQELEHRCGTRNDDEYIAALLPARESEIYKWPSDLLFFHCGFLLNVDEKVRIRRIVQRAPPDKEETLLAEQACMRLAVMQVYRNMNILHEIHSNTSREAVNLILSMLPSLGVNHDAVPFTTRELQEVQPC